ncbi:MAG TPA: chromate resistance protein ChrB domain-containing protein [Steroidobacter sp.]|uniref:chromate resistance protein ChrB domain-containing protein n=1 Tax=Steroidobacter sp. TaxID=1978227 RepID=UPI002ED8CEAB
MSKAFDPTTLYGQLGLQDGPLIVDLRTAAELEHSGEFIPTAVRVEPDGIERWCRRLTTHRQVAMYSSDDAASNAMATQLESRGISCGTLTGGFHEWRRKGLPTVRIRPEYRVPGSSRWVTRERPKIDRLACPWLVRRFIDPHAVFFYVPAQAVRAEAAGLAAEPYDIADVTFSHRGPRCSFDAFLDEFGLHDPVLDQLADIVRAADTATLERSREAPGLLAISLGMSATIRDDILLLEQAMFVYDSLYAWCKTARDETHSWPQTKGVPA